MSQHWQPILKWLGGEACAAEKNYSELIHRCKVVSSSNIKRAPAVDEEKQEKRILGKRQKSIREWYQIVKQKTLRI